MPANLAKHPTYCVQCESMVRVSDNVPIKRSKTDSTPPIPNPGTESDWTDAIETIKSIKESHDENDRPEPASFRLGGKLYSKNTVVAYVGTALFVLVVVFGATYAIQNKKDGGSSPSYNSSTGSYSNRVTEDNFRKIKKGMHYTDVTAILGQPDKKEEIGNHPVWSWKNGAKSIYVLLDLDGWVESKIIGD